MLVSENDDDESLGGLAGLLGLVVLAHDVTGSVWRPVNRLFFMRLQWREHGTCALRFFPQIFLH